MKNKDINIRDPFVLSENGKYYMYGTRAKNFGVNVDGVDVYISDDLENWSEAKECLRSSDYGLNGGVNWAPEVHKYRGRYYMFITFTQKNGLRGTYVHVSEKPEGPFKPHSIGAVTPDGWECLDGTLYVENGVPYLVFCHEHVELLTYFLCLSQALIGDVVLPCGDGCADVLVVLLGIFTQGGLVSLVVDAVVVEGTHALLLIRVVGVFWVVSSSWVIERH